MKQILLGLLLTFSTCLLFSQNVQKNKSLVLGITQGVTRSNLNVVYQSDLVSNPDYESKQVYYIGLDMFCPLLDNIFIKSGIIYDKRSSILRYKKDFLNNPLLCDIDLIPNELDLNYISIPVMVYYQSSSKLKFNLSAGLLYSSLVNASYERVLNYRYSIESAFKRNNLSSIASVGMSYPLQKRIQLTLNYINTQGLTNVSEQNNVSHMKTSSNSLVLGINYSIK
jgi:hypothetical protein